MTRIRYSSLYVFLLVIFSGSFLSGPVARGQNRVVFTFQNRQLVSGVYQAELWANVAPGTTWAVGNCLLNIGFNRSGLAVSSFNNAILLNTDPEFLSGGYIPISQVAYGTGLSVNILNTSGFFIEKSGSFRIGTLRWQVSNGFAQDSLHLINTGGDASIIMHNWETFSYDCGDTTCYSAVTPVPMQVGNPPVITQQPQSAVLCAGNDASFSVTATGAALTYQWQRKYDWQGWQNMTGETTASLTISSAAVTDTSFYRVIITGDSPPVVTSNTVNIQLLAAPVITLQPISAGVCEGNTTTFTVNYTGTPIPTILWEVSSNNGTTWSVLPSTEGTVLSLPPSTSAMNGFLYRASAVNNCGTAISQAAMLSVQAAPEIITHPKNMLATAGDTTELTAAATGTGITYQWQKNMTDISGATTPTLTLYNVQESDMGTYRVLVSGSCTPAVASGNAVLFVQAADTSKTTVAVKALMQGSWNGLVHTRTPVSVELRSGATLKTSTLATISTGILSTSGTVSVQFSGLVSGEYWIVVRHGGYLPVASNGLVQIDAGSTVSYNFSDSPSKAYDEGTIPVVLNGTTYYVLKAGDFTGDQSANPQDIQAMLQGFPKTNSLTMPGL